METAPQTSRGRLKRVIIAVAVLLASAAIGALLGIPLGPVVERVVETDDSQLVRERLDHDIPPINQPSSSRSGPDETTPDEVPAIEDETLGVLEVECVSATGEPIPDLRFDCRIQSKAPEEDGEYYIQKDIVRTSDADGRFRLITRRGRALNLRPNTDSWFLNRNGSISLTMEENSVVRLVFSPARTIRIRAMYDDGQPVTQSGSLTRGGPLFPFADPEDAAPRGTWSFGLGEDGTATVPLLAVDRPLKCTIFGWKRPGYQNAENVEISVDELASGRELQVVVYPHNMNMGNIRVEFVNGRPAGKSQIFYGRNDYKPSQGPLAANAEFWQSGPLRAGYKYQVTVLGGMAWRSDWIDVVKGENTVVIADLQPAGSVRARLLDGQSNPLARSVLRVSDGGYLGFTARGGTTPLVRPDYWTNDKGEVLLAGLPPGRIKIEAEAWLHEPVVMEVDVVGGETHELGDIVLNKAVGEVTVEVTGRRDGMDYAIVVFQPSGVAIRPFEEFQGDSGTVKGLALRAYRVAVTTKNGGRVVGENCELTPDNPNQTIRIDVSTIEPYPD